MAAAKTVEELSEIVEAAAEKRQDAITALIDAEFAYGDAIEAWSVEYDKEQLLLDKPSVPFAPPSLRLLGHE